MASITIRNLDDEVKTRLRVRAAGNGRSMEEEARKILREAVDRGKAPRNLAAAIRARIVRSGDRPGSPLPPRNLAAAIRARIASLGGVELELPPR